MGHWSSREFNPFLLHEIRRALRRRSGPLFILWPLVLIAVALAATALFSGAFAEKVVSLAQFEGFDAQWAKRAFGQNVVGWMALVASGLSGYATLFYSNRAASVLQREHAASTITQIYLLPLPELRLAFLTCAPAAFWAIGLWLLLLPIWLLALLLNQWSWREFFGLPILFLLITVRPPQWTPIYNDFFVPRTSSTDEESDEEAEAAEHDEEHQTPTNAEQKENEEDTESDEEAELAQLRAADPRFKPLFRYELGGLIAFLCLWQGAVFLLRIGGFHTPPGVLNYLLPQWRTFLPPDIWDLLPSFLLSWPLILIRALTTPLPFFSVVMPLGFWLIPRAILMRYADFPTFRLSFTGIRAWRHRRWGRGYRTARRFQTFLFWFFASGFLWPKLINSGALAAILPGAPINPSWARAALWTLLLVIAAWLGSSQIHSVFSTLSNNRKTTLSHKLVLARCRKAWRQAKGFFYLPPTLYFLGCFLSGTSGFDGAWQARFGEIIVVVFAFVFSNFCVMALRDALPKSYHFLWAWLRFAWFWGLLWELAYRVVWAHYADTDFNLSDAPHGFFSPNVALFVLLNSDIEMPLCGAWWQLSFSLVLLCFTVFLMSHKVEETTSITELKAAEEKKQHSRLGQLLRALWRIIWFVPDKVSRFVFWPVKVIGMAFYRVAHHTIMEMKPFLQKQAQAFAVWSETLDNPVLQRALRVRWRITGMAEDLVANWFGWLGLQIFALTALLGFALLKPAGLIFYGGNTAYNRQAALVLLNWRDWGTYVFILAIIGGLLINLTALSSQTKALDRDRKNGGLVFLFLTPLSEREIVGAYTFAALLPGVWLHSALYLCIFLSLLLNLAAKQFALLPLFFLLTILLHALLVWCAVSSAWSAIRATDENEGAIWAVFGNAVPQGILLIALLFVVSSTNLLFACCATFLAILLSVGAAYFCWLNALRSLKHQRYGDVSVKGTVAN